MKSGTPEARTQAAKVPRPAPVATLAMLLGVIGLGVAASAALIAVQATRWAWFTQLLAAVVMACITAVIWLVLSLSDRRPPR